MFPSGQQTLVFYNKTRSNACPVGGLPLPSLFNLYLSDLHTPLDSGICITFYADNLHIDFQLLYIHRAFYYIQDVHSAITGLAYF